MYVLLYVQDLYIKDYCNTLAFDVKQKLVWRGAQLYNCVVIKKSSKKSIWFPTQNTNI